MLRPGSKRINWNSLGINDFLVKCESVGTHTGVRVIFLVLVLL